MSSTNTTITLTTHFGSVAVEVPSAAQDDLQRELQELADLCGRRGSTPAATTHALQSYAAYLVDAMGLHLDPTELVAG